VIGALTVLEALAPEAVAATRRNSIASIILPEHKTGDVSVAC